MGGKITLAAMGQQIDPDVLDLALGMTAMAARQTPEGPFHRVGAIYQTAFDRAAEDPTVVAMCDGMMAIKRRWDAMTGPNLPLKRAMAGPLRDFDYNLDGLAHYGMFPDMFQDLKNVGFPATEWPPCSARPRSTSRSGRPAPRSPPRCRTRRDDGDRLMPSWYIHTQAAAQTLERLNAAVPAGSPLSAAEAMQLFTAGHDNRNYLGGRSPRPRPVLPAPRLQRRSRHRPDEARCASRSARGRSPIRRSSSSGRPGWRRSSTRGTSSPTASRAGCSGRSARSRCSPAAAFTNMVESLITQMEDIFGLLTSGTQAGYEDSAFFWSDAFHYRKTYHFARTLYKNALNADAMKTDVNEPSRVPKQQAFALGWISHCAADVAGHPFTNAKVGGPYRTHWQRHHVVENHMDALVYRDKHGIDPMASLLARSTRRRCISGSRSSTTRTRPSPRMHRPPSTGSRRVGHFPPYPQGEDLASTYAPGTTRSTSTAGRCPSTSASS